MDLSIVLVNWNGKDLVDHCIRSIEASKTACTYEILVSDNASTDGSQEWLRTLERTNPRIRCVFNPDNAGFGVGNNRALPFCRGEYVLFLNTDTLVLEPLDALVGAARHLGPACGALGGRVLNADHTLQLSCRERYTLPVLLAGCTLAFAGIRAPWVRRQELERWDHATARDVAMVSGCYLLVPRAVLDAVGPFDPNIFLFFEDTDLCYRIREAGYTVRYAPVSPIVHLDGGSRANGLSARILQASVWSARYFTRTHLGRSRARMLAVVLWLCWLALWCVCAPLGLLLPFPGARRKVRQRAELLGGLLWAMPRQRFPRSPYRPTTLARNVSAAAPRLTSAQGPF